METINSNLEQMTYGATLSDSETVRCVIMSNMSLTWRSQWTIADYARQLPSDAMKTLGNIQLLEDEWNNEQDKSNK